MISCGRRIRTIHGVFSHRTFAGTVVNPLFYVYQMFSTPETGGLVCQFQHITICGRTGIRTPDTFQYAGFQDRCIQPLCHSSFIYNYMYILKYFLFAKIFGIQRSCSSSSFFSIPIPTNPSHTKINWC